MIICSFLFENCQCFMCKAYLLLDGLSGNLLIIPFICSYLYQTIREDSHWFNCYNFHVKFNSKTFFIVDFIRKFGVIFNLKSDSIFLIQSEVEGFYESKIYKKMLGLEIRLYLFFQKLTNLTQKFFSFLVCLLISLVS